MKWYIYKAKHKSVADAIYEELIAAGIRVDHKGPRFMDSYWNVAYMPIGKDQQDTAYEIIDRLMWDDLDDL